MKNILAATGHRLEKLGGYAFNVDSRLFTMAEKFLEIEQPDCIISGMALGWDMAWAEAGISLKLPVIAAVPFNGQDRLWALPYRRRYEKILESAQVSIICSGGFSAAKMQIRNEWMVDHCTRVIALWDGSSGGTGNCVRYAHKRGVHVLNMWPLWEGLTNE